MTTTREGLTIECGTAKWGGPTVTVTVNDGPLQGRTFWMRSTEGHDNVTLEKGGGFHIDASEPDGGGRHDWRGVFRTYNVNEAIDSLVEYINELAERRRVQDESWAEMGAINESVREFGEALEESSMRDFRAEWVRIREAVAAMEIVMAGVDGD